MEVSLFRAGLSDRFYTHHGCNLPEFSPDRPAPKEIVLHYYTFNIGDYRRDTTHLTLLEHGIYRQLIDTYYLSERPLCADHATLMRTHCVRTEDEQKALESVLKDFFDLIDGAYHHKGCNKNIGQYREKSEKASNSAKARWEKNANALPTQSERNAIGMLPNNHKPITNKQEPIKDIRTAKAVACPVGVKDQVWEDFLKIRKAKRSPMTETALQSIQKECAKAGWSLDQALQECVSRGWQGFKAEWVQTRIQNKQEALEARNKAVGDAWLAKMEAQNATI